MHVMIHVLYHSQHLCGSFSRLSNNTPHHHGTGDKVKVTPAHAFVTTVPMIEKQVDVLPSKNQELCNVNQLLFNVL